MKKKLHSTRSQEPDTNGAAQALQWGPKLYTLGCLLAADGTPIPDQPDRDREVAMALLAAFTERRFAHDRMGTAEAQEALTHRPLPVSQAFFDSEASERVQSFLEGNGVDLAPWQYLSRDELKAELRALIAQVTSVAPDLYRQRLERYGLNGALIQLQHDPAAPTPLAAWQSKRVSLDDVPETWWGDYTKRDAILECALFEWARCGAVRCKEGAHWVFTAGWALTYCRAHRRKGWNTDYAPKRKERTLLGAQRL